MNVGILLAAGNSTRFGSPKQLTYIGDKMIIEHSLETLSELDKVIIVTNPKCYETISKIRFQVNPSSSSLLSPRELGSPRNVILISEGTREDSIKKGLKFLWNTGWNINKVIVHDAARPFVTKSQVALLLQGEFYSQFVLKLTNGLAIMSNGKAEPLDRNKYFELCTPVMISFELACKYLSGQYFEFLDILNEQGINYSLHMGCYRELRKITYPSDLEISNFINK